MRIPFTVTFSMCPCRETCVISQNASAALKYMRGVGAEPRPPRLGPSSQAKVMCPAPLRWTVANFRNGVTAVTSASNTISRLRIDGSSPSGAVIAASSSPGPQAAQYLHRLRGLGPPGGVRIGVDRADGPFPVGHQAPRDGPPPQ